MANLKRHLLMSATIAIIIHVIAVMLFVVGYQIKREQPLKPETTVKTVRAEVISSAKLAEESRRREAERKREELERQRKLAEQERLKQEKLKYQEEQKKLKMELAAEKKKVQEAQQRAKLERKMAREAEKRAALEKKRVIEAAKRKAEEAKIKQIADEKKRKEQEKLAEQQRLAKILEQEEAELKAVELEAQRVAKSRAMSRLIAQYRDAIRSRIQSRWRKPVNDQPNSWCKVFVRQAPGGYVENVVIEECTGDETFRRSVEEAVWKSDPLPSPPLPELFDRELRFKFIPKI